MPVEGCPCSVLFVGRVLETGGDGADGVVGQCSDSGVIFETNRDVVDGKHIGGTDDPKSFQLLRGNWLRGCDVGVATMVVGERASFILRADYAYGGAGLPPKVMPGATLVVDIELMGFGEPLPRFPSQAELAAGRKERAEEEQRQAVAHPPPTCDERIRGSNEAKEKANTLYRKGELEAAQKEYDTAFVHIFVTKEEWEGFMPAADKAAITAAKLPLHLNRAACKLKLGKHEDAQWDCEKAIEISEELGEPCPKGHFRRGAVFMGALAAELRKEADGVFWDVEKAARLLGEARGSLDKARQLVPADKMVKRALRDLAQRETQLKGFAAAYRQDQKRLFRDKMLGGLDASNRRQQQEEESARSAEQRKLDDAAFNDMPALDGSDEDEDDKVTETETESLSVLTTESLRD
eukprot:g1086.t1